jgi:hypothetical protein
MSASLRSPRELSIATDLLRSTLVCAFGLTLVFLSACSSGKPRNTLHVVATENRGGDVHDFRIQYGDVYLPFGTKFNPLLRGGASTVFIDEMVVPDWAEVRWRTPQGRSYCPKPDIRRFVQNPQTFEGDIEFSIEGDRLEVFVFTSAKERLSDRRQRVKPIFSGSQTCD